MKGITTYQNGLGIDDKLRSKNGTTVRYFLTDHLGSTEALANASGAIVSSTSYDSFGNATSNITTTYRYTGQEYDADTGLYYYRNRWYDPELGRFISKDPIGFAGGDINLYGYVGNNPYGYIDPYGFWRCAPSDPPGWLDAVQLALSAAGMVNVVGEVFDVVNAGISVARGNYSDAVIDASSAIPFVGNIIGAGKLANRARTVIGKLDDLKPRNLKPNENTLLKHLPPQGNPKANWKQNSSVLRQEIRKGLPIRDASVKPNGELRDNTGFLKAERNLLRSQGWTYNSKTRLWSPPK